MPSDQKMRLREAAETDSDAVYSLKKAAFSHYVKKQYGNWNEAEQREYHITRFASNDVKIITVDRRTVGFVSIATEPDCIKVNQLVIHPKHQSQGIGEHCMTLIKQEARRMELPVRLQVMKVNPRARKFYQYLGFVVVGETETHLQMELKS